MNGTIRYMRFRSIILITLALAAAAPRLLAANLDVPTPQEVFGAPGNRILLRVAGVPITIGAVVRKNYPELLRLMQTREAGLRSGAWSQQNQRDFEAYWDLFVRRAMALAVRDELLFVLAEQAQLKAFPSIVEKTTEERLARIGGEQVLKERGFSLEDLKKEVERDLLVETVLKTQAPPVYPPGPARVRAFYDAHKADFVLRGRGYRARIILIPMKAADGADNRPLAEKIAEDLAAGGDFGEMAAKYSVHASKSYGGLVVRTLSCGVSTAVVTPEDLPSALRDHLPRVEVGKPYGPVEADARFQFLLVEKTYGEGCIPLQDVAQGIADFLRMEDEEESLRRWLARLAERYGVTNLNGESVPLETLFGADGSEKNP